MEFDNICRANMSSSLSGENCILILQISNALLYIGSVLFVSV